MVYQSQKPAHGIRECYVSRSECKSLRESVISLAELAIPFIISIQISTTIFPGFCNVILLNQRLEKLWMTLHRQKNKSKVRSPKQIQSIPTFEIEVCINTYVFCNVCWTYTPFGF